MPYTTAHKMRTRERILDSARRLFTRAGYENVTIDDVMAHAGLTRGGFYNHFSNKADLFAAAVETYGSRRPGKLLTRTAPTNPLTASPAG